MAECVRQSSPSVARQEPEANMSEVEVLRRIKEPEMSKTMFWIVEELKNVDTHTLYHPLNQPFLWIMFIIQLLIRV